MENTNPQIDSALYWFSRIYLGGIPATITDDSAFLSFVCVLTAIEALAGYRYPETGGPGDRFREFVNSYFPESYKRFAKELWGFRTSIVHAFTTGNFALTHHHSEVHFRQTNNGLVILNAEDFYGALLSAAQVFFSEVRTSPQLQELFLKRLQSPKGGGIAVGPIQFPEPNPAS